MISLVTITLLTTVVPYGIYLIGIQMRGRRYPFSQTQFVGMDRISKPRAAINIWPFVFKGTGESLFMISLVNVFRTVVTFGIYVFWAKVRVRHYLYDQTEFAGDHFRYHGTGWDLMLGFFNAIRVVGVPFVCLAAGPELINWTGWIQISEWIQLTAALLAIALFVTLFPVATVRARRYRLAHTSWRGIRGSFVGSDWQYFKLCLTGTALSVITLGVYYPFFDVKRQAFLISHSRVGNQSFSFDGNGWGLTPDFLTAILLTPFTLGLCWNWYSAWRQQYYWAHTSFAGGRFAFTGTGGALCRLRLENSFFLACTMGLAWPWTTIRNISFVLDHLTFMGPTNLDQLAQALQSASPTWDAYNQILIDQAHDETEFDLA